jgi:hypothetical protein
LNARRKQFIEQAGLVFVARLAFYQEGFCMVEASGWLTRQFRHISASTLAVVTPAFGVVFLICRRFTL